MIYNYIEANLEDALKFQKNFAEAITSILESHYDNHGITTREKGPNHHWFGYAS